MKLPTSETLIIIPTYWAPATPLPENGEIIYDHPTPLTNSDTLTRCLESLKTIEAVDYDVLIVAGASTPRIQQEMADRVEAIAQAVRPTLPGRLFVFTSQQIPVCREEFSQLPVDAEGFLKLDGYPNVRNAMLLLASVLDAKRVVMIDDDEYVTDPDFLGKVLRRLETRVGGKMVDGLGGYYLTPEGEWETAERDEAWSAYWPKNRRINRTYRALLEGEDLPDLVETPMVFGGCLAMTRHLYRRIPFDRRVPRGEDMDYLLNARMFGYHFFMHRYWSIVHDPPPKTHATWKRMRMDIVRFLNERQKIGQQVKRPNMTRVEPHELDPYPGEFLRDDLMDCFFRTTNLLAIQYLAEGRNQDALECLENIALARDVNENPRDGFANLLELQIIWEGLHDAIAASESCRREILSHMTH
jgi:GT2 family glycosyltransferase